VCTKREGENNGRMNENKNGKNEDEFERSIYVRERERERKKSGHLHLTPKCVEQKKKFEAKENELHFEKEHCITVHILLLFFRFTCPFTFRDVQSTERKNRAADLRLYRLNLTIYNVVQSLHFVVL
jgi:hypothetical protein